MSHDLISEMEEVLDVMTEICMRAGKWHVGMWHVTVTTHRQQLIHVPMW